MVLSGFVFGLLGSLHCIGMCGPIALMLPISNDNTVKKIAQVSLYHLGRVLGYGTLGFIFGVLGKNIQLFGFQQQLSIGIGILIILIVSAPKIFKINKIFKPIYFSMNFIKKNLAIRLQKYRTDTLLSIGFLNAFLPCGLVYLAILGAIETQDIFEGAFYMIFFGMGTIPLMTVTIYIKNFIKPLIKQRIQKTIPFFIIIMGILFILRGLGLGIPYLSPKINKGAISTDIQCH